MKHKPAKLNPEINPKPNLYLVGFMGTGKSALGRRLAKRLSMRFLDSDEEIEKKCGMKVREIFEKLGESRFREMEREFMESGHPESGCVVSCGGGLVCSEGMPELVKRRGVSIALFAPPEVVYKRVSGSGKRPLLNVENPLEKIRDLMQKRMPFYLKSGVCVASDGNISDVEERVERIYLQGARAMARAKRGK